VAKIKIAIVGVGNCASSLVQGIAYYKEKRDQNANVKVVAAFDIDKRKVGKDVSRAIFELPNCTTVFHRKVPRAGVKVTMGKILDGVNTPLSLAMKKNPRNAIS